MFVGAVANLQLNLLRSQRKRRSQKALHELWEGEYPAQQINSDGVASFQDHQQFAFVVGLISLSSIECLALEERRL